MAILIKQITGEITTTLEGVIQPLVIKINGTFTSGEFQKLNSLIAFLQDYTPCTIVEDEITPNNIGLRDEKIYNIENISFDS